MAIGDEAKLAAQSYVALSKESTYGTYASATAAIEAISCTFRTDIDSVKLDQFSLTRDFSKRVQTNKNVAGTLEKHMHPQEDVMIFAVALGGGIATTSLTAAATHSLTAGNFDTSPASLSFNIRKGGDVTHTWRYSGGRINSMKLEASVGEPVRVSYDFIFKDSTLVSDNIANTLSVTTIIPFIYHQGTFKYADTEANAANSTNAERIQSFELTINNNLEPGRELGSSVLRVLPPKRREVMLTISQRFDTTTSYNRFTQATQGAVELFFRGQSVTSEHFFDMTIRMPKVFQNSPDPELPGANEILSAQISYDVLTDNPNTTTGKAIGVTFINSTTAGY